MKKGMRIVAVAALVFQLTGCMAITGKRMGALIDDTVIVATIKNKYIFSNDVHALWIDVDSHNGDVVLVGSAQSRDEEDIAIRLAKYVDGVRSVTSFLKIKDLAGEQEQQQVAYDKESPLD